MNTSRHARSCQRTSILLPSYPRLLAGIHLQNSQDGFPMKNVGNDEKGKSEIVCKAQRRPSFSTLIN
jgi:hypothetical protein